MQITSILIAGVAYFVLGGLWFTPLFGKHWGLSVALALGLLFITSVNAISPNMPRPGLYALVTGSYHAVGLVLVSAIQYWLT